MLEFLRACAARRPSAAAIVVVLIALGERLHPDGVTLPMTVTSDRVGATGRFNQHVREQQLGVDLHRRDVGDVNRFFLPADPPWCVLYDGVGRDEDLRREE